MKTDLIKEFNLPSYIKGKSFAQASKLIESKFKGRNDKASVETKQELLERLSSAQEYLKSQMEPLEPLTQNQGMFGMNLGEVGTEGIQNASEGGPGANGIMNMVNTGLQLGQTAFGKTGIDTSGATEVSDVNVAGGTVNSTLQGAQAGMALGPVGAAVGGILGLGAGLIGGNKAKKDAEKAQLNNDLMKANKYRPNDYAFGGEIDPKERKLNSKEKQEIVNNDAFTENSINYRRPDGSSIFTAYSKPSYPNLDLGKYKSVNYFNPTVSEDGRYTLNNTKNNPANAQLYKEQLNYIQSLNPNANIAKYSDSGFKPLINQQAMGGYQNKYDGLTRKSSYINNPTIEQNIEGINIDANKLGLTADNFAKYQLDNPIQTYQQPRTQAGKVLNNTGDFLKNNYDSILRLAPIVGNLTDKLEKPNTERGSRLQGTYRPQLFDEKRLVNQVNQNNLNSALTEASGGNLGALRSNLLASHLNKTKAISDAYAKGEEVNRGEQQYKFQTDRQKDIFNIQQDERFIERKAQDEGAYNTAKSAKRAALFEDIGNLGKEESYKKMVKKMYGYTWDGKYFVNDKGERITKSQMDKKVKNK